MPEIPVAMRAALHELLERGRIVWGRAVRLPTLDEMGRVKAWMEAHPGRRPTDDDLEEERWRRPVR